MQHSFHNSKDGHNENLLILLHGLGDNMDNFAKFGIHLELPQTAIVSIQGPCAIPFFPDNHYAWFSSFDESGQGWIFTNDCLVVIDAPSPEQSQQLSISLEKVVRKIAFPKWTPDKVFFLGYAQGAAVAICYMSYCKEIFGGLIAISPTKHALFQGRSPVLITVAEREVAPIGTSDVYVVKEKAAPGMPKSAAEVGVIMAFLASKLYLRNWALENLSDVYQVVQ